MGSRFFVCLYNLGDGGDFILNSRLNILNDDKCIKVCQTMYVYVYECITQCNFVFIVLQNTFYRCNIHSYYESITFYIRTTHSNE